MDEAQPLINDPHRGFKGFLPAVFAYRVAERFTRKVGDPAYVKLTAPAELVRHKPNLPDAREDQIIKSKFQSAGWKKADYVEQEAQLNGKRAFRILIPEYYETSCLVCHGGPKGEKDISGGKKKAASWGISGAQSVGRHLLSIYDKSWPELARSAVECGSSSYRLSGSSSGAIAV